MSYDSATVKFLTALAEVDWSHPSARGLGDFSRRLQVEFQRFDEVGINYRHNDTIAPATISLKE
jgi:hypothetical protein